MVTVLGMVCRSKQTHQSRWNPQNNVARKLSL